MKRPPVLLLALLLPILAPAQVPNEATDAVKWAFQTLATSRSIRIRMSGTESFGGSTIPLVGELYWYLRYDSGGQPVAKIEYTEYKDNILVQRVVGDGKTFYSYAPLANEYWVASYGTHGPAAPARYLPNLVDNLTTALKGSSTYLARLIREVYVVNGYRAWIPGGQEDLVVNGEAPVRDPLVTSRVYVGTPSNEYALFWFGNPAKKSLAFEFSVGGINGRDLRGFWFTERTDVAGTPRLVDWRADVQTDFIPAKESFIFIPPANARIIVGPRPNIG